MKKLSHSQKEIVTVEEHRSRKLDSIEAKRDLTINKVEQETSSNMIARERNNHSVMCSIASGTDQALNSQTLNIKLISDHEGLVESTDVESRDDSIPGQVTDDAKIDHNGCNVAIIAEHVPEVSLKNSTESLKHLAQKAEYETRRGAAGAGGQLYEVKLLMLFLLRCLRETDDFSLAKNVKFAGDFDDVVLKYSTTIDGVKISKAVFMQAKHKDNIEPIRLESLLADHGNFSVAKYFRSYLEIREKFDSTDNPISDVKLENCEFIFYTNNKLHPDSDKYFLKTDWKNTNIGVILRSSEECTAQLMCTDEIVKTLCARVGVMQLAREMYDYAFGKKKDKDIKKDNTVVSENHIPLANLVLEVHRSKSGHCQFQTAFVYADDTSAAKNLWDAMLSIERAESHSETTEEEFSAKLETAHVKVFKSFGKFPLDLNDADVETLAVGLSGIIRKCESSEIEIREHLPNIEKLANNVLVRDDRVKDGIERVKFTEKQLTGKEGNFLAKLKEFTESETLQKFSFCISKFPRFSFAKTVGEADVREFLKQYHFFVGQSNESKLDGIIKREIRQEYDENEENGDLVFVIVKDLVEKWWKESKSSCFLTKCDHYFVHAKQRVWTEINRNAVQKFGIHFAKKRMKKAICDLGTKNHVLIFSGESKWLSVLRVLEVIDDEKFQRFDKLIYLTLDQVMKIQKHILQGFHNKDFIMIEGNWTKGHLKILRDLSDAILNRDTKVIFITDNDESKLIIEKHFKVHAICDQVTLDDLSVDSQKMILEKEVQFHGKPIRLGELTKMIGNFSKCDIHSQMIIQLINDEQIIISNEPVRFCHMDAAYAKLFTEIRADSLAEALRKSGNNKYLFSFPGTKMNDCVKLLNVRDVAKEKVIMFPNEKREAMLEKFHELCAQETSAVIYWFEVISDQFYLQQLYDPHFYTNRRLNYPEKVIVAIDVLLQRKLSDTFIIKNYSGKERIMSLLQDCESKYEEEFETLCNNSKILFESSEWEANNRFINLCEYCKALHLLQIDELSSIILLRSQGPLLKSTTLKPEILLTGKETETCFIVTGAAANEDKLKSMLGSYAKTRRECFIENCKMEDILFVDESRDTKALLKEGNFKSRPVHVLAIDEDDCSKLVWLHSTDSVDELRNYVIAHDAQNNLYDEVMFSKHVKDKFAVIADDPGMGKSTTLTSLSRHLLETNWVIRVDFRECGDAIKALPTNAEQYDHNLELVCYFFSQVQSTGMTSKLAMKLFVTGLRQSAANNQLQIVILFDAFDEINSDQQRKVCLLLKFLRNESLAKVWVTTRRNKMRELENCLSTFATKFIKLDQCEQEEFLFSFWQKRLFIFSEHDADKLRKFSKRLLSLSIQNLGVKILLFIGVPLHLRLLAEGYQNVASEYCKDTNNAVPILGMLNLVEMYKRFVTEKYHIYFREKTRLSESSPYIVKTLFKSFNKHHQYLAFEMLFPKDKALIRKDKLPSKEDESDLISVGIIQSFGSEGSTYFTHKTFAEYFAADLLVCNLQKGGQKSQSATQFLLENMFLEDNIVVRRFIDRMLSSVSPVHVAALENDMVTLVLCQLENQCKIVDHLGRTALHLAAQEGHLNIVKVLLDEGWDAAERDVFGKTALHYATMSKHEGVTEHLTSFAADIDIYDHVFRAAIQVDRNPHYLTSNLAKFVNHPDASGKSSLSYAALNQDWSTACILILSGASISSLNESNHAKFLKYCLIHFNINEPPFSNHLFPVTGILLATIPHIFNSKSVSQELGTPILFYFLIYGHGRVVKTVLDAITESSVRQSLNFLTKEMSTRPHSNDTTVYFNDIMKQAQNQSEVCVDEMELQPIPRNEFVKGYMITHLHFAAAVYDLESVKQLLYNGANVNAADESGQTALDYAFKREQLRFPIARVVSTIRYLFIDCQAKCSLNPSQSLLAMEILTTDNLTLLHEAVRMPTIFFARYLFEIGANVNMKDEHGRTPLHCVASDPCKNIDMVIFLLQSGAVYNPRDNSNQTVLEIYGQHETDNEIYKLLKQIDNLFRNVSQASTITNNMPTMVQNAVTRVRNENEDTLMHLAIAENNVEIVQVLMRHYNRKDYAAMNAQNLQGNTALHLAAETGNSLIVHMLLERCTMYNATNCEGKTPGDIAKDRNHGDIVRIFTNIDSVFCAVVTNNLNVFDAIVQEQCVFISDQNGTTLLHWAAYNGNHDLAAFLLKSNAQIEAADSSGCTPLHYAAQNGHLKVVKYLLKSCARFNPRNKEGKTPAMLANRTISDFFQLIHDTFQCATDCNTDMASYLERMKERNDDSFNAVIHSRDAQGNTLLHIFAEQNKMQAVKFALQCGAPYDAQNEELRTPDMVTSNPAIEDLFKCLSQLFGWRRKLIYGLNEDVISAKMIVNARKFTGDTLLHWAGRHKPFNYYRLNFLLDNGADINATDNSGMYVLEYAILLESHDYVKFLLKNGAEMCNIARENVEKLRQSAEKAGRQDIIVLLQHML